MANIGYVNMAVREMYGIPYSQLTDEQKKILHADSLRRAKLIAEREEAVLRNNLKAFEDEAKMERVLASIYRDCQKQILADVAETMAKVKKAGGTWSYANQSALTRSRGLFEQITAELTKLGQKEQAIFTQGLSHIYTDQFLRQVYELGQSIPVKANFNRLNPNLIRQTLDYPWSGAMFSDRLWLDKETLGRNLRVGLTQSMILGEGIPEITDRITKNIDTARYNAERVARTETKRVAYVAHDHAYADTGIEELEYRCANGGDHRTCGTCKADNGKRYERGKEPTLPRHPNCRCVYIPVVPDTFSSNELNELTGSVRGAENYEKWLEANKDKINPDGSLKDGWVRNWKEGGKLEYKGDPVAVEPVKKSDIKNAVKTDKVIVDRDPIKLTDYPEAFYASKAEAKNTQALLDYINSQPNADKSVVAVYRAMDKLDTLEDAGLAFKISHGSSYALSRDFSEWKLTIPKLDVTNPSTYVTTLHEEMHLLDAMVALKKDRKKLLGMQSRSNEALKAVFSKKDTSIGDKVKKLFEDFDKEYGIIHKKYQDEYTDGIADLREQYRSGKISWKDFDKLSKKLWKTVNEKADADCRNALGGGVSSLQDIYDALSGGSHRDKGVVHYGHGGRYYSNAEKRPSEALANYGALAISHPELIELLKEDKPELVSALAGCILEMLEEVK